MSFGVHLKGSWVQVKILVQTMSALLLMIFCPYHHRVYPLRYFLPAQSAHNSQLEDDDLWGRWILLWRLSIWLVFIAKCLAVHLPASSVWLLRWDRDNLDLKHLYLAGTVALSVSLFVMSETTYWTQISHHAHAYKILIFSFQADLNLLASGMIHEYLFKLYPWGI